MWGATTTTEIYTHVDIISIHAPRVGSDLVGVHPANPAEISIHAPRVGSDSQWEDAYEPEPEFQSTLPVWGATKG